MSCRWMQTARAPFLRRDEAMRCIAVALPVLLGCGPKIPRAITSQGPIPLSSNNRFARDPSLMVSAIKIDAAAFKSSPNVDLGFAVASRLLIDQHAKSYSWFGKIGDSGIAVFVIGNNGSVTGFADVDHKHFEIIPYRGGHVLTQRKAVKKTLPEHPEPQPPTGTIEDDEQETPPGNLLNGKTQITTVFAYTKSVADNFDELDEFIQLSVDAANAANLVSDVPVWFTVEGSYQDDYVVSDCKQLIVDFATPSDHLLDGIHTLRDERKGDLAILLFDDAKCANGFAGTSAETKASAATAFSVVNYKDAVSEYSVAHEIGHLFGSNHDYGTNSSPKPYSYGHGWRAEKDGWRTIMATACSAPDHCPRLTRWSSKQLNWGDDHADNVRLLRKRRGAVSTFR